MNGETAVYGVIGKPVSHSLSPQIHGYLAELCGLNMAYLPFYVEEESVPEAIRGAMALGISGLNVTVPHKKAVMPFLAEIDPMAERVGAVNTLVRTEGGYIGHNTDYIGIQRSVQSAGFSFAGQKVVVLGAGGSAYAACVAAADQGAAGITIINRSRERAVSLASHINSNYNIPAIVSSEISPGADIMIQTTTLGFGEMAERSPVLDLRVFEGLRLAFDIIYAPWETVFLRQARQAGVPMAINGFPMLVYQAIAAFQLWHKTASIQNEEEHIKILSSRLHAH